ncbi:GlsB/YeaQ/YmgE family stress response membrane protein [Actinoplanes sp. NPDC024001]|uniref:GlsB/YeaQ/YmgE family stress response membrane protein n=1 Tax=Actinoplanes sp. NPDC024001 TaxID=3154598 RepID=UPI0033D64448
MTAHSLITAVILGLVIGVAGRMLLRRSRSVPVWLPIAAGVAAAVLATVIARMANTERSGPTVVEIALQVLFALAGVTVVAITADRPPAGRRVR